MKREIDISFKIGMLMLAILILTSIILCHITKGGG